ncbi:homeobox protein meis3 [Physcia stellaris]|nr:homeobox protein meis3 [Physcia stellaris]
MAPDAPGYPGPHGQPLYIDNFQPADNERRSKKRRGNLPKWQTDLMRSWYNAHVHNPYPTDEEKHVIMQETGLTIEQVANWFINCRRRHGPEITRQAQAESNLRRAHGSTTQGSTQESPTRRREGFLKSEARDVDVDRHGLPENAQFIQVIHVSFHVLCKHLSSDRRCIMSLPNAQDRHPSIPLGYPGYASRSPLFSSKVETPPPPPPKATCLISLPPLDIRPENGPLLLLPSRTMPHRRRFGLRRQSEDSDDRVWLRFVNSAFMSQHGLAMQVAMTILLSTLRAALAWAAPWPCYPLARLANEGDVDSSGEHKLDAIVSIRFESVQNIQAR